MPRLFMDARRKADEREGQMRRGRMENDGNVRERRGVGELSKERGKRKGRDEGEGKSRVERASRGSEKGRRDC